MSDQSLVPLLKDFCLVLKSYDHFQLNQLQNKIIDPPIQDHAPTPTYFPVLKRLPSYLKYVDDDYRLFADKVGNVISELCWYQSYTESDFGKAFIENYAYSELIGTRGPLTSDTIAAGIFVLGPNILYPSHSHEAAEFYSPYTRYII